MSDWSGYSIAAVALIIIGIIMLIIGFIMWDDNSTTTTPWSTWLLIIGGIIFMIIGFIVGLVGRSSTPKPSIMMSASHTHMGALPPLPHYPYPPAPHMGALPPQPYPPQQTYSHTHAHAFATGHAAGIAESMAAHTYPPATPSTYPM